MLKSFTLILVFQLIGELLTTIGELPVPGPVIGMVLLFIFLMMRAPSREMEATAGSLLNHMALLFIPAGVGVVLYLPLLGDEWLAISTSLLIGTVITIAVTALVMKALNRTDNRDGELD